ncbi:MAG: tRNA (guanosine(37)-N1)-methyltransferase TrmD [Clostridiales bacterium 38-18]|nr:MAG: tRNA (guanosine(37)-N1)-methyltransferase TrmD [Clostridiales bacterium 38-18]
MIFHIMTLFPEQFEAFKQTSIIGRAAQSDLIKLNTIQIRDFSLDKHKKVDDAPFGGGAGMVMTVQPLKDALRSIVVEENHLKRVIYLSPRGETLTHDKVIELSTYDELILVCGHYEGVDQRFIDSYVDEELSIGDYVLTGGELAAMVVVDSVSRLVSEVLKNSDSSEEESFAMGLLEYPHYTRPTDYEGKLVPEVLLSGNHAKINDWRLEQALRITKERRPDLYETYIKGDHSKKVREIIKKVL